MSKEYEFLKSKSSERSFNFFVKESFYKGGEPTFRVSYFEDGRMSGFNYDINFSQLLFVDFSDLVPVIKKEKDKKPIKVNFYGRGFKEYPLENLLELYAKKEGVNIIFKYHNQVRI
jgi:hypothetical protein